MKDRFEHILSEKLRDITMEPASRDWMAIERSLGIDGKARKVRPLYRYAAAAAAVLLVATVGVTLWRTEPALAPEPLLSAVAPPVDLSDFVNPLAANVQENEALDAVRRLKEAIVRSAVAVPDIVPPMPEVRDATLPTTVQLQPPPAENPEGRRTGNNAYARSAPFDAFGRFATSGNAARRSARVRRTPNSNWSLSFFANGAVMNRNVGPSAERMLFALNQNSAAGQYHDASQGDPNPADLSNISPSSYLIQYDQSRSAGMLLAEVAGWEHARPLGAGVRLRRGLTERLGVETGFNYTFLASKQETSAVQKKQELHYLGIPVALTYTPLRTRSFELYGRVGGAADFNIAGRTRLTTNGVNAPSERLTNRGVQWSLSANAGAMYRLTPSLGIYVEPGVSHRFEFAGQPDSYWKEHPTAFDLQIGFRADF